MKTPPAHSLSIKKNVPKREPIKVGRGKTVMVIPHPHQVEPEDYGENYDRIFGKKNHKS